MIKLVFLKILGFILMLAGALTIYGARFIALRYKMSEKAKCQFEDQLSEEELKKYKEDKAVLSVKLWGAAILLPGLIILLVVFR